MKSHRMKVWYKKHKLRLNLQKQNDKREYEEMLSKQRKEAAQHVRNFNCEEHVLNYIKKAAECGYRVNIFSGKSSIVDLKTNRPIDVSE